MDFEYCQEDPSRKAESLSVTRTRYSVFEYICENTFVCCNLVRGSHIANYVYWYTWLICCVRVFADAGVRIIIATSINAINIDVDVQRVAYISIYSSYMYNSK